MFGKEKSGFPKKEEEVLEFWERGEIFKKSIELRADSFHFLFMMALHLQQAYHIMDIFLQGL